jgi:hypothetical protein
MVLELTSPEETPVAMMVFAAVAISREGMYNKRVEEF